MRYEKSLELFEDARRLIPGGSQTNAKRPQAFAYGAYPIYVESASGCRVRDIDGNEYIDLVGACGPIILGYAYGAVDDAVREQLEKGIIGGLLYPLEVEVARLFTEMVPCAEMVRFFKGGGAATAAAARIARAHTGRELILNKGYRGWPDVWATGSNDRGVPSGLKGSLESFPMNDVKALEELFSRHKGEVAAVFLDIIGEEPEEGYLQAAKDLAHENGALFVMDEVITGFRLAPGGAQEYYGVTPDVACFAKGMANGLPVSAVAGRADVMDIAQDLLMTITYGGEALSLAGACACMKEIRDRGVTDHLWKMGKLLADGLESAAAGHGIPFRCGSLHPMHNMTFEDVAPGEGKLAWGYMLQEFAERGVLLRRGGVNFVSFSHTEEDVAEIVAVAEEVFRNLRPLYSKPGLAEHVRVREYQPGVRDLTERPK